MGRSPVEVRASFPAVLSGGIERHAELDLAYESGVTARLIYSWAARSVLSGLVQTSSIEGENGHIRFESNGLYIYIKSRPKTRITFSNPTDFLGYKAMTRDFLNCLEGKTREPYSNFARAERDLRIVFDAYDQIPKQQPDAFPK
jgi:predicted dehydrogenase